MFQKKTNVPFVVVSPRGAERVRSGHLWIYRSDVVEVEAEGGDVVEVVGVRGGPLGTAFYSDRSQISLRLVATRREAGSTEELVRSRIDAALDYRESLRIDATAYRLIHAEADALPSVIVDRYGDVLVLQALSQGAERVTPLVVARLVERLAPKGILARNDARVRELEGLERKTEVLHGDVPDTVVVREGEIELEVDLRAGQKTGLFLDQRENHVAAARTARGRALDAFSYDGGFALHLARVCDEVVAVDISEDAVGRIRRNAERNRLGNVEARAANAFDLLRELERAGERFDVIVLDPPAFAKNRAVLPRALGGYKEINLRALKLLASGGTLVTCSCSYHVDEETLLAVVNEAAADAGIRLWLLEKRMQASDHPVLLGVPETQYLKCLIFRKLDH